MPINYTVTPEDKLIYAVELMLEKNIKSVSVVRSGRPIGMVRLEDALKKLGLNVDFLKYNINV
ncbi:MAG: CBS domain-containing protein [Desulfobacteraceae bacterium]|nr:CBS domain-containing protein [Desulfobacteraceae bacterium]MBC2756159.1 CBS domain-containing protein [Desulfobacteraceae bacterium]